MSTEQKWVKMKFVRKGNYPSRMGYYDKIGELQQVDLYEGLILELPAKYAEKDWFDAIPKAVKKAADKKKRARRARHRRAKSTVTAMSAKDAFERGAEIIDPVEAKHGAGKK